MTTYVITLWRVHAASLTASVSTMRVFIEIMFISKVIKSPSVNFVVVALLFYVHGKHLRSCRDGQLT